MKLEGNSAIDGYLVCEDFITSLKLNKETGLTVFCAFSLSNTLNVAHEIRNNIGEFKQITIVIYSLLTFPFFTDAKALCCTVFAHDYSFSYPDCVKFPTRNAGAYFNSVEYLKKIEKFLLSKKVVYENLI